MTRSCSSVAGPAAFPAISYRWESSQSGPVTWYSVTCQAQRIAPFRLTLRMVTVPGDTWVFPRPLGTPSAPGWLTLTDATSKVGTGASADWPNAAAAARRINVRVARISSALREPAPPAGVGHHEQHGEAGKQPARSAQAEVFRMQRAHFHGNRNIDSEWDEGRDYRRPGTVQPKQRARQNLHQAPADQAGSQRQEAGSHQPGGFRRETAVLEEQGDGLLAEDQGECASAHRDECGQRDGLIDQLQRVAQAEQAAQAGD